MQPAMKRLAAGVLSCAALYATALPAAQECNLKDPQADALLKKMSDYLGALKSFTVDAAVVDEQIMDDGFKLQTLRTGRITVQRPDKLHVLRHGPDSEHEVFFDGAKLTAVDRKRGMHVVVEVKGDIDAALDAATEVFGAELPARDLLSRDAYTPLMTDVRESAYLEPVQIGDRTCRQLAFRSGEVDWQIWIEEGEHPLPCRYTITSKWTYGAPSYTITLGRWQMNPELAPKAFEAPTAGSQKVDLEAYRKAIAK